MVNATINIISNPITVFTFSMFQVVNTHTHPCSIPLGHCFHTPRKVFGQENLKIISLETKKCQVRLRSQAGYNRLNVILKTGSGKIIYWLCRFSFLLGFNMSKKVRSCVLNIQLGYKITNLLGFFDIIKPRRKEYLPSQ